MNYYVYQIPPIDCWGGAMLVRDYPAHNELAGHIHALTHCRFFDPYFRRSEPPRVMFLPGETQVSLMLVVKRENNGDTYVVSEFPLEHLEGLWQEKEVVRVEKPHAVIIATLKMFGPDRNPDGE